MSKKGQDNQRGINFQNKVALLYMLDHYKYSNFIKIKLEGNSFEDFTLFFSNENTMSNFFYSFEVKNWTKSLTLNDVKNIIRKEINKGIGRYSEKDVFCIIASSVDQECKNQINSFKEKYLFHSEINFEDTKELYKKIYGDHPILEWKKEEIIFIQKKLKLMELKKESVDKLIRERFAYEESFFYTKENTKNIIGQFFLKISNASSSGKELTKQKIKEIISEFCNAETGKSESYDSDQNLGKILAIVKENLQTEDQFETLSKDRYITPISKRVKVIFYIVDELEKKKFQLKKVKWFFDKILIKNQYMLKSMSLLEMYAGQNILDQNDKILILEFIFKLFEYESKSSFFYKHSFNLFYRHNIFKILLKLSNTSVSDEIKQRTRDFLDQFLPNWQITNQNHIEYDHPYVYRDIPQIIKNLFECSKDGIQFIFKKHDFTISRDYQKYIYYDYIKEFINQDFKNNFWIVVKELTNQFKILHQSDGESDYYGYELYGGGYSGTGGQFNLHTFKWEFILSQCIEQHCHEKTDDEFLTSIIKHPVSKDIPVFVKRSCIPFLLNKLQNTSKEKPKENIFYKYLESTLEVKKGLPRTEDTTINELYGKHPSIPDVYLDLIIEKILYKYSKDGISHNIHLIRLMLVFIENGKTKFKDKLKRILLNNEFQKSHQYDLALKILEGKINNQNIKNFFDEIRNKLDLSQNNNLLYIGVQQSSSTIEKLFNSSSKKDLDTLADLIQGAVLRNGNDFIKNILKLMERDLEKFYKRAKISEYLIRMIAQVAPYALSLLKNEQMAEDIIEMCMNDTDLYGESKALHKEIATETEKSIDITTMRAYLCCYSIDGYISYYSDKKDEFSLKKLETAFSWVKILMDLDGTLADNIPKFPKPNYYLRYFATIPLIGLSYRDTRQNLNRYTRQNLNRCKLGLGDEVKNFCFDILEKTKKEIKENQYNPTTLLKEIGSLFDIIRDLNEKEAKKVLSFIREFDVRESGHLFIYYALFRDKHFKEKGVFKNDDFKDILTNICKGSPNELKQYISFIMYKNIRNLNERTQRYEPDFEFFEQIKDYWILLFENFNKEMQFSLISTLAIILERNKTYYDKYRKKIFEFVKKILEDENKPYRSSLHMDNVLKASAKYAPNDLTQLLFLLLDKGDSKKGWIPFHSEVMNYLIPQIRKQKDKISPKEIKEAQEKLSNYGIPL